MGKKEEMSNFKEVKATKVSKDNRMYVILIIVALAFFGVLLGIIFSTREVQLKIDEVALETAVKSSLITIAQEEFGDIEENGVKYAEGHKVLRSEINGGKVYAYTVAEYGQYKIQAADNTEKTTPVSATTKPMVLVFTIEEVENTDNNKEKEVKYVYFKSYKVEGKDDKAWQESLEILFPVDLVNAAKVDYADDFYQNQIRAYLVTENTNTENGNQNVVENTVKDTNESENEKKK